MKPVTWSTLLVVALVGLLTATPAAADELAVYGSWPDSASTPLTSLDVSADSVLVLYAGTVDSTGSFVAGLDVDWSLTAPVGTVTPSYASLTVLDPIVTGDAMLRLEATGYTTHEVPLHVRAGALREIRIVRTHAATTAIGDTTLVLGAALQLHATGFDVAGNRRSQAPVVTWSLVGGGGTFSTTTDSTTIFTATVPGSARLSATASGISASTGLVQVVPGPLNRVRVSRDASSYVAVTADTLTADEALVLYALGEDATGYSLGPVSVSWISRSPLSLVTSAANGSSVQVDAAKIGSGRIVVTTGQLADSTAVLTVVPGATGRLVVENEPGGTGNEVGARQVSADSTLTLHAIGRDGDGNYTGPLVANWGMTSPLGTFVANPGSSVTFVANRPGSATFTAQAGVHVGVAGPINVVAGAPHHLEVEDAAGAVLGAQVLAPGAAFTAYAGVRDADGNRLGRALADWSWNGSALATLPATPDSVASFTAGATGSSQLAIAKTGLMAATSGTFTVTTGSVTSLIIRDTANGGGTAVNDTSLTSGLPLTLYAAAYDAGSNYLGDTPVTWSVIGLGGSASVTPGVGSSTTLTPGTSGNVRVVANHTTGTSDSTGTLQIAAGALSVLRIVRQPSHVAALGDTALVLGDTLQLHVRGWDTAGNVVTPLPSVSWSVSGTAGTRSPATGNTTTFTATTPGSARLHANAGNIEVITGVISVSAGTLSRIRISSAPDRYAPLTQTTKTADETWRLYAWGEDATGYGLGLVDANWTSTTPQTLVPHEASGTSIDVEAARVGTGRIHASAAALADSTALLQVTPGSTATLQIETAADGSGAVVGAQQLSADATLALHAVGRDGDGNFTGALPASWAMTAPLGSFSPASGSSVTFVPDKTGTAALTAQAGARVGVTGAITVVGGVPHHLEVEDAAGVAIGAQVLSPASLFTAYAGLRDADGNRLGRTLANWSWNGAALATLPASPESLVSFTAGVGGMSQLAIAKTGLNGDTSGTLTVTEGTIASIVIRDAANGVGSAVGTANLTSGLPVTLYAAAYDAANNYLGDTPVTWSVNNMSGSATVAPLLGSSTTLTPGKAGNVRVLADHTGGTNATTGDLDIAPGALTVLRVVRLPSHAIALGDTTLVLGDTLRVYANGWDAAGNVLPTLPLVSWSVTGTAGSRSPATGSSTTFTGTSTGSARLHALADGIEAASGVLSVVPGALSRIRISTEPDRYTPLTETTKTADQSWQLYAWGEDATGYGLGLVTAAWTSTSPSTLTPSAPNGTSIEVAAAQVGSGRIMATAASLADTTALLQVTPGATATLQIETAADGSGMAVETRQVSADSTLSLHAVGRDADGNFTGPLVASWSMTSQLGTFSANPASSVVFAAARLGTASITAQAGARLDAAGPISVVGGAPYRLEVEDAAGLAVGAQVLAPGSSFTAYAGVRDQDGNRLGRTNATWSWNGSPLATPPVSADSLFAFTAGVTGTAQLVITAPGLESDTSGTITVTAGSIASLVIRNEANGNGAAVDNANLTAALPIELYASAYDAGNNYLGDTPVTWSVVSLGGSVNVAPVVGSSTTLTPGTVGDVRIVAAHESGISDSTGTLHIHVGTLSLLRVVRLPQLSTALGDTTLALGDTLRVHARGWDAAGNALVVLPLVSWSVNGSAGSIAPASGDSTTFTATTPGTARLQALADGVEAVTGILNVTPTLGRIRISSTPDRYTAISEMTKTADQTWRLYAWGEDATGYGLGLVDVNWTSTAPQTLVPSAATGTSIDIDAARTGTGHIAITLAALADSTALLQVTPGATAAMRLETKDDGSGHEIGEQVLSADSTLTMYAVGRDEDGNFTGLRDATWGLTSPLGNLSSTRGTSATLDATTLGTGLVTVTDFPLVAAAGPLTVVAGSPHHLRIENASHAPLGAHVLSPGQSLVAYAGLRDADDNSLGRTLTDWTWLGTALAPLPQVADSIFAWTATSTGSSRLVISAAGVVADTSATLTVTQGTVSRIAIRDAAGGLGSEVESDTLTAGNPRVVYAAAYDAGDNYLGDATVTWDLLSHGGNGVLSPLQGSSTVFTPQVAGALQLVAAHASGAIDSTRSLEVVAGALQRVHIESAADGTGAAVGDATLAAGDTLILHGVGRDAWNNYVGVESVDWSVYGGIGALSTTVGSANTFTAQTLGTGSVAVTHTSVAGSSTGTLQVVAGAPSQLLVEATPLDPQDPIGDTSLTVDDSLVVYAVARDAFGNLVQAADATWSVDSGGATLSTFGPSTATVLQPVALGNVRVRADWSDLSATSGLISIGPGLGTGSFVVAATPGSLRADGVSRTTITFGPIQDRLGNPVANGTPVSITTTAGHFDAADANAVQSGLQLVTSNGVAQAQLVAPSTPGTLTVSATAAAASGEHGLTVLAPVDVRYVAGSLTPTQGSRGAAITLSLRLQNLDGAAIDVDSAMLEFGDGNDGLFTTVAADSIRIAAGAEGILAFASTVLPTTMDEGTYSPVVTLAGHDMYGHAWSRTLVLGASTFRVSDIQLLAVRAGSARVARGDTLSVFVDVRVAGTALTLDAVGSGLMFTRAENWDSWLVQPSDGALLPADVTTTLRFGARPNANATLGVTSIDAFVSAKDQDSTIVISGAQSTPSVEIIGGADARFVSLTPTVVTSGAPVAFRIQVANDGDAQVVLNAATTTLQSDSSFTATLDPTGDSVLEPQQVSTLTFLAAAWPVNVASGTKSMTLELRGSEGTGTFHQSLAAGSVLVQTPALLQSIPGTLDPNPTTASAVNLMELQLRNVGQSTLQLATESRLRIAARQASLATSATLKADSVATLLFTGLDLTALAPGSYPVTVEARGTQNGASFSQDLAFSDPLQVSAPAVLDILGVSASQTRVTQGQTATWTLDAEIQNNGGTTAVLDSVRVRFQRAASDVSSEYTLNLPSTFTSGAELLPGGATRTLRIPVTRTGTTVGDVRIDVFVQLRDTISGQLLDWISTTDGGATAVRVETPPAPQLVGLLPSMPAVVASQSRAWGAALVLRNAGGADIELVSMSMEAFLGGTRQHDYTFALPATFSGSGDAILRGGATDTLHVVVTTTGTNPGALTLRAGVELLDALNGTALAALQGDAAVAVQSSAQLELSPWSVSRPRVISGTTYPWTLTATLTNTGGTGVDLSGLDLELDIDGTKRTREFLIDAPPLAMLAGGASTQLVFTIQQTPVGSGPIGATLVVDAVERLSLRPLQISIVGVGPQLDTDADLRVLAVGPQSANRSAPVDLWALLFNAGGATAELDTTTTLLLGTLRTTAQRPATLAAMDSVRVDMRALQVPATQPLGPTALWLELRGQQNGEPLAHDLPAGNLQVDEAAAVVIRGIAALQPTVTRGQTRTWEAEMLIDVSWSTRYRWDAVDLQFFVDGINRTTEFTFELSDAIGVGSPARSASTDTLHFQVTRTADRRGVLTLEASVLGTDLDNSTALMADTQRGGRGSLLIQNPAQPVIDAFVLSQPRVTHAQSRPIEATLDLRNAGEADMVLSAFDVVAPAGVGVSPSLLGPARLVAGATTRVQYVLSDFNLAPGSWTFEATPSIREVNRDLMLPASASLQLLVEEPALLQVSGGTAPATLSAGQTREWPVSFALDNLGGSAARLLDPALVIERDGVVVTHSFDMQVPSRFVGTSDLLLSGAASDTLTFVVTRTDSVAGDLHIALASDAEELNSGRRFSVLAGSRLNVSLQTPPRLATLDTTLTPRAASRGQRVQLGIDVVNQGQATLTLDPSRSRVRLTDVDFVAGLSAATTLPGQSINRLVFAPSDLPADAPTGEHVLVLELAGSDNGNDFATTIDSNALLRIDAAAAFDVISVTASQARLTSAQTSPWTVEVTVQNRGASAHLEAATLLFTLGTVDVSPQFSVLSPTLFASGSAVLASGDTQTLTFTVQHTAAVQGLVVIDARLELRDLNSNALQVSQSSGAARGSVRLDTPAAPRLVRLQPSQPQISAGQTGAWRLEAEFRNEGGSRWTPDWSSATLQVGALDDSTLAPTAFDSGPETLDAGDTGIATYIVHRTGSETGRLALLLSLAGTQETDGTQRVANTALSASIDAVRPARLGIAELAASVPRPPFANSGQQLPLRLRLQNSGEAALSDVRLRLRSTGVTVHDTTLRTSLPAGGELTLTPTLQLADSAGAAQLEVIAVVAVDSNDSTRADAWGSSQPRQTLDLAVQRLGLLRLLSVEPSQARVSAGQSTDWWITLRLANDGDEALLLRAPRPSDITFRRDGLAQADYTLVPPEALLEGGLEIAGGDQGTLVYRVSGTGASGGSIEIAADATANHTNDPSEPAALAHGSASLEVDDQPGLRILTVDAITWRRDRGFDDYRVNQGQHFGVRVSIENTGGTALDSVVVQLDVQRGASVIEANSRVLSLEPAAHTHVDFAVTAGQLLSRAGEPEIFIARIAHARDRNSGVRVLPEPALDNNTFAFVERRAELALSAWIASPDGARDGSISTSQEIVLAARVDNAGAADISETGQVRLVPPAGFVLLDSQERYFRANEQLEWRLQSPSDPMPQDTLRVALFEIPRDQNDGDAADVMTAEANVEVRVQERGALASELFVVSPEGARDSVVSSGQTLVLEARLRGGATLVERIAELNLPAEWTLPGGSAARLEFAAEAVAVVRWTVQTGGAGAAPVSLAATARDPNTGEVMQTTSTLAFTTVSPAELELTATIVAPEEALDHRLVPGQRFTMRTHVRNLGQAGAVGAPGQIRMTALPAGYQAEVREQVFTLDASGNAALDWSVSAPLDFNSNLATFRFAFFDLPLDENSALPVVVRNAEAGVTVSLSNDVIEIQVSHNGPAAVVPGQQQLELAGLNIRNVTTDAVALDSLAVFVPGTGDERVFARLRLERNGMTLLDTQPQAGNPIWLAVPSQANAVIDVAANATFTLWADLVPALDSVDLRVSFQRDGAVLLRVVEAGSRTPLAVELRDDAPAPTRVVAAALAAYNAPNPFRIGFENTTIYYRHSGDAAVQIHICTLHGLPVWETSRRDHSETLSLRSVTWDGRNGTGQPVRNGVYVCRVQVGGQTHEFKIAVVR